MRPLQKQRQPLTNDSWYFQAAKSPHGNFMSNTRWQKSGVSPFFVFLEKRLIITGPMPVKFSLNINLIVATEEHLSLNFKIYSNKMNLKVAPCCHVDF